MAASDNRQVNAILNDIVTTIRSRGGRFLRKLQSSEVATFLGRLSEDQRSFFSEFSNDLYEIVTEKVAIQKTKQCFRHFVQKLNAFREKQPDGSGKASCSSVCHTPRNTKLHLSFPVAYDSADNFPLSSCKATEKTIGASKRKIDDATEMAAKADKNVPLTKRLRQDDESEFLLSEVANPVTTYNQILSLFSLKHAVPESISQGSQSFATAPTAVPPDPPASLHSSDLWHRAYWHNSQTERIEQRQLIASSKSSKSQVFTRCIQSPPTDFSQGFSTSAGLRSFLESTQSIEKSSALYRLGLDQDHPSAMLRSFGMQRDTNNDVPLRVACLPVATQFTMPIGQLVAFSTVRKLMREPSKTLSSSKIPHQQYFVLLPNRPGELDGRSKGI